MKSVAFARHEHPGKDGLRRPDQLRDRLQAGEVCLGRVGQDGTQRKVLEASLGALGPQLLCQLHRVARQVGEGLCRQSRGLYREPGRFQGSLGLAGQLPGFLDRAGLRGRIAGVDKAGHRANIHELLLCCRAASNRSTVAAIAALSDSAPPAMGIETRPVARAVASSPAPVASPPTINAAGCVQSTAS